LLRLRNHHISEIGKTILVLALTLSVIHPLTRDAIFDWQLTKTNTKKQLKRWIRRQPEGIKVKGHGFEQRSLHWLRKKGYDYVVMSSHSWEPVAAHPDRYPKLAWEYRRIFAKCQPVAIFRNPWFDSDFFAPHHLLNSATVNVYHGQTLMVLKVPKKQRKKHD